MTAERALYHRLMLEVGRTGSFDRELDELLERNGLAFGMDISKYNIE